MDSYPQLKVLHAKIKNYYEKIQDNITIEATILDTEDVLKQQLLSQFSEFEKVQEYIKKCTIHLHFKRKNIYLHSFISVTDYDVDVIILKLKKITKRIQILIEMFGNSKTNLVYWLIPTPNFVRIFPKIGEQISQKHINGGYTYLNGNQIYIYRAEEFPKVLLHETLHHLLDSSRYWSNKEKNILQNAYNIVEIKSKASASFEPNEAIIETWANIFQSIFLSIELNVLILLFYEKEVEWGLIQSKRIFIYQGKYFQKWREETNAYSCIVFRSMLLYKIEEFLKIYNLYYNKNKTKYIENITKLLINTGNDMKYVNKYLSEEDISTDFTFKMSVFGDL